MQKTVLKIAGVAVPVLLSAVSHAVTLAPATSATTATIATGSFILSSFTFSKSIGVGLAYTESTSAVVVNAGNTKGGKTFGGSSNGGSVKACTAAPSTSNGYTVAAPSVTADGCS